MATILLHLMALYQSRRTPVPALHFLPFCWHPRTGSFNRPRFTKLLVKEREDSASLRDHFLSKNQNKQMLLLFWQKMSQACKKLVMECWVKASLREETIPDSRLRQHTPGSRSLGRTFDKKSDRGTAWNQQEQALPAFTKYSCSVKFFGCISLG